jgi:predicted porin
MDAALSRACSQRAINSPRPRAKRLLFATVLATPPDVVSPQTNVTLYGVVDKGFEPTDTGQRVSLRMDSGSLLALQFVINGRENLGCGQFLNLQFEGGLFAEWASSRKYVCIEKTSVGRAVWRLG